MAENPPIEVQEEGSPRTLSPRRPVWAVLSQKFAWVGWMEREGKEEMVKGSWFSILDIHYVYFAMCAFCSVCT